MSPSLHTTTTFFRRMDLFHWVQTQIWSIWILRIGAPRRRRLLKRRSSGRRCRRQEKRGWKNTWLGGGGCQSDEAFHFSAFASYFGSRESLLREREVSIWTVLKCEHWKGKKRNNMRKLRRRNAENEERGVSSRGNFGFLKIIYRKLLSLDRGVQK